MFTDININGDKPVYLQIKDYIKEMITRGILQEGVRLPSTRELSEIIGVSRNTVIMAYKYLEDEGLVYTVKNRGVFVSKVSIKPIQGLSLDWKERVNDLLLMSDELDIMKKQIRYTKETISFQSIAPDGSLFDIEGFKRAFLTRIDNEGENILNYGYAKGYRPLIEYLLRYMKSKGVDIDSKDILITNGFTEGFDILMSGLVKPGESIICENPTHNTAIKIMKLHGVNIVGVDMNEDGIDTNRLKKKLEENDIKLAYLVPSYHNPTGIVMSPERRVEVFNILKEYKVPIIEDGFNEELRYSGSHVSPMAALSGSGNSIIYTGSFSKVLFPGLRVGWIFGDSELIYMLESIKRSRNIHTSVLDQAVLYQYLLEGNFERYVKRVKRIYKERYERALECAKKYIPCKRIWGEGGLHIFIELDGIDSRSLLEECFNRNVLFTPGDIFFTDGSGKNTLRIGFGRVDVEKIEKGMKIVGEVIKTWR